MALLRGTAVHPGQQTKRGSVCATMRAVWTARTAARVVEATYTVERAHGRWPIASSSAVPASVAAAELVREAMKALSS